MAAIPTIDDATFDEEVKGATEPVLVDFWAEWCGPCKMISPILEEIASEHDGRIQIRKLNIEELRAVAPAEIFRGGNIGAGKHSMLVRTTFQSHERTLREDEISAWSARIIDALKALGGQQR